jgi:hypothetical protein
MGDSTSEDRDDDKAGDDAEALGGDAADAEAGADELGDQGAEEGGDEFAAAMPIGTTDDELLADAEEDQRRTRASWHLISKEVFTLLFANCFFFAGTLVAWYRGAPGDAVDPANRINGLDTIRGALLFGISIYGFWAAVFNIWHRQHRIRAYLIGAILALWIGIGQLGSAIGSPLMDEAMKRLNAKYDRTVYHEITYRLGVIPPSAWLLTIGGAIVLVTLIRGIMQGAQKARSRRG